MKMMITLLMGVFFVGAAFAQEAAKKEAPAMSGKQIFIDKKCVGCHSIEAEGIVKKTPSTVKNAPPDLSAVGADAKPGFLAKYITKEADLHGKKHMIKFAGTDAELKTLTAYLEGLKGKKEMKEMKEMPAPKEKK
jgi:mono/diheme cytochrome c family protein